MAHHAHAAQRKVQLDAATTAAPAQTANAASQSPSQTMLVLNAEPGVHAVLTASAELTAHAAPKRTPKQVDAVRADVPALTASAVNQSSDININTLL